MKGKEMEEGRGTDHQGQPEHSPAQFHPFEVLVDKLGHGSDLDQEETKDQAENRK